jgi:hypothetical protein
MRLLTRGLSAAALLLAPLAALPPTAAAQPHAAQPAPLLHSGRAVPGQYIVTVGSSVEPASFARKFGVKPRYSYGKVLRGFAASLSQAQVDTLRRTPGVAAVEENGRVSAFDLKPAGTANPGGANSGTANSGTANSGSRAGRRAAPALADSWGLDRIDQRALPLDRRFVTHDDGRGATAYIMDTGIDYGHSEFGGRAVPGFDSVGDGRRGEDCQGHGTHVAGTVGGTHYGVAPAARLVSVRVLDCAGQGTDADVLAAMDWVAVNAIQPAVLNASLGGAYSPAVNEATNALARSGVLPVVAAGNATQDACGVSPASAESALTVGASDESDHQTDFSNYGACVSLFAPGKDIVSALRGGGSVTEDGTSMASPHAAGVALLYKAQHPAASAAQVARWLLGQATQDVLTVDHGSPNRLLYTGGL